MSQRLPFAGAADVAVHEIACNVFLDSIVHGSDGNLGFRSQAQALEESVIAIAHAGLAALGARAAFIRVVRAGLADVVGAILNNDVVFRMGLQSLYNLAHVLDEFAAIPFSAKPEHAEKVMRPNGQTRLIVQRHS